MDKRGLGHCGPAIRVRHSAPARTLWATMTAIDDLSLTPHVLRVMAADLRQRAQATSEEGEANRLLRLAVSYANRAWAAEVREAQPQP